MRLNRKYDPAFKEMIIQLGNPQLRKALGVPRQTFQKWVLKKPEIYREVLSTREEAEKLKIRIALLERENSVLRAKCELLKAVHGFFQFSLRWKRIPESQDKRSILNSIAITRKFVSLPQCLELIGLSRARYYSWKNREKQCQLADYKSCPKKHPTQITAIEISKMKEILDSNRFKHFSLSSLALYAARNGLVCASNQTWRRIIKRFDWKHIRTRRKRPPYYGVGVRAEHPNQIWHIDVTIIRLENGKKAFLQAIIDNRSRRIVTWEISSTVCARGSYSLLKRALGSIQESGEGIKPNVFMDSGIENLNLLTEELEKNDLISRTVAQVDVIQSNSMIEAFFRKIKTDYLRKIKPSATVEELHEKVSLFVDDYNQLMPHRTLRGATPDEVYRGIEPAAIVEQLKVITKAVRDERVRYHRSLFCLSTCPQA